MALTLGLAWIGGAVIDRGFPGAVESLPPRLAVVPGIYGIRIGAAARRQGLALVLTARRHALLSALAVSAAAAFAVNAMVR